MVNSEKKLYTLTIFGQRHTYAGDMTFDRIAQEFQQQIGAPVLLVRVNHRVRELYRCVSEDGELQFLTMQDPEGMKAYQRSLCLLMLKASEDLYPGKDRVKISIHYVAGGGLYCTAKDPSSITEEYLEKIQKRMRELVEVRLPIRKFTVSTTAARRLFKAQGMDEKADLFLYRRSSRTNLYSLDGYVDYYYGPMVPNTSFLTGFCLTAYRDGFVLRYPAMGSGSMEVQDFHPVEKLFQVQKDSLIWADSLEIQTVADLNRKLVEGDSKELMLTMEAWHEKQIAQIAQEIASQESRKLVLIAGPSSSGKTTFSHRLSTQLSVYGLKPHPIAVDDYFVDREKTPRDENGEYDYECLEALDIELFNKDMNALLAGETVELPAFNFKTGKREYKGHKKRLGKKDILVIEGIHGLNDRLTYSLPQESKFRIYISALTQLNLDEHNRIATTDGRLIRRIVRDARTRGITAKETIARWPSVRRGEENHIFPHQHTADIMFNSALIYELAVLKIYAEPLLFGISRECVEYEEAERLLKFLDYFVPMPSEKIPQNSLIREFIGGSCFEV